MKCCVSGAHITQRPLKAKQMRINRKREKLRNKGFNEEEIAKKMTEKKRYSVRKNVEDFIDVKHPQNAKHVLEVRFPLIYCRKKKKEKYLLSCVNS